MDTDTRAHTHAHAHTHTHTHTHTHPLPDERVELETRRAGRRAGWLAGKVGRRRTGRAGCTCGGGRGRMWVWLRAASKKMHRRALC